MRVLLVEDNEKLGVILQRVLQRAGIEADWARDGAEAFDYMNYSQDNLYDVVVLDWMLPGQSGPEICKVLRNPAKYAYQGGVLFLTARDALEDRVAGLEAGGDDYLAKPFENAELLARLKALNRRKAKPFVDELVAIIPDITLNRTEHKVVFGLNEIQFSPREFEIFDRLLLNIGNVLPRNTLIDQIWGAESDITQANLDSHIYLLRKKIKPLAHILEIKLHRGVGYKIEKKS